MKEDAPTKTRVIALSCGIKISAVAFFLSSPSTRVTDRRQTDRQNCDSLYRARIVALHGNRAKEVEKRNTWTVYAGI